MQNVAVKNNKSTVCSRIKKEGKVYMSLTLGILQPFPVRVSYFAFSVVRGATALSSLGFSAIFLRWALLEEESKEDSGCYNSLARWLDDYSGRLQDQMSRSKA